MGNIEMQHGKQGYLAVEFWFREYSLNILYGAKIHKKCMKILNNLKDMKHLKKTPVLVLINETPINKAFS